MTRTFFTLILFLFTLNIASATTWDEPWMEKVIKEADHFVLAKVLANDEDKGIKIEIIKQLGGKELSQQVEITNFYLLDLMSNSKGHGPEFHFEEHNNYYFFIKQVEGKYCIATPTTGFTIIVDDNVHATYRHSYHQARVPIERYETTMTAIFNKYHQIDFEKEQLLDFIKEYLSKAPAGFDEDQINTFFMQHVALELIYHLELDGFQQQILPFFNDKENFHNRASAARALSACKTEEAKRILINKIASNKDDDFTTVLAIWSLEKLNPTEHKKELSKLLKKASKNHVSFGGDIMDPRIGTMMPSVNYALRNLVMSI